MRAPLWFFGLVAIGVGEALWARVFLPDSLLYAVLAVAGAASAWVAAGGLRRAGLLSLLFVHVAYTLGFAAEGFAAGDVLTAALIAAGLGVATWADARGRGTLAAGGFATVAVAMLYWLLGTFEDGLSGYFPGNVLVAGGAVLAAASVARISAASSPS